MIEHLPIIFSDQTIALDSFNRSDNATAIGTGETGHLWTITGTSVWGIYQNSLRCYSSSGRAYIDVGKSNVILKVKILGGISNQRIIFRFKDTSNEMYFGHNGVQSTYALVKRVSNSLTTLAQTSKNIESGDNVKIVMNGSSIRAYVNGAMYADVTDSANSDGTKFGVFLGGPSSTGLFDNLSIELV